MNRLIALMASFCLSVFFLASVAAASGGNPANQQDQQVQQREKTGKQTAKAWQDREKRRRAHQKLAAEMRQHELSRGSTNEDQQMTMK